MALNEKEGGRCPAYEYSPPPGRPGTGQGSNDRVHHSSVCVPCVIAPPARSAAATSVVSASSCSVAPAFLAFLVWSSMQYGHCVVSATAMAISSLYLSGITPYLTAASSKATNALKASGASSPKRLNFPRFFMSYIAISWIKTSPRPTARDVTSNPHGPKLNVCSMSLANSALEVHRRCTTGTFDRGQHLSRRLDLTVSRHGEPPDRTRTSERPRRLLCRSRPLYALLPAAQRSAGVDERLSQGVSRVLLPAADTVCRGNRSGDPSDLGL